MGRLDTMARFAESDEPKCVTCCANCFDGLYEGDTVIKFENEYYCDDDCFFENRTDIKAIILGE